jgi:predicted lactoylglutathione lyase
MSRGLPQRVSLVTLGVRNLDQARTFYETLGWRVGNDAVANDIAFYQCGGMIVALWDRDKLAEDSGTAAHPPGAVTLACNVSTPSEVDAIVAAVGKVGGTIVRDAEATFWGGYSGIIHDPDGHPWEIAYNPFWRLDADDSIHLPA